MVAQNSATLPTTYGQEGFGTTPAAVDTITEFTASNGVTISKAVTLSAGATITTGGQTVTAGNLTLTAGNVVLGAASAKIIPGATSLLIRDHADANSNLNILDSGATTIRGAVTPSGGIAAAGGFATPTVFHSGGIAAITTTQGTDTTPVNTETYIVEVFVENNCTLTGVSILNGSAVAGNVTVGMFDSAGNAIAAAKSASTAQSGTAAYQQIPFAAQYAAVGPAKYFIGVQFSTNTTPRYRAHILGNFGASKKTGEVYGTFTNVTPPTTFATAGAVVADTY